jgi:hypothetical protein
MRMMALMKDVDRQTLDPSDEVIERHWRKKKSCKRLKEPYQYQRKAHLRELDNLFQFRDGQSTKRREAVEKNGR